MSLTKKAGCLKTAETKEALHLREYLPLFTMGLLENTDTLISQLLL